MLQLNDEKWFPHIVDDQAIVYSHRKTNRPLVISFDTDLYYIYAQGIFEDTVVFTRKNSWSDTEIYADDVDLFYSEHLSVVTEEESDAVEQRFLLVANITLQPPTMDVTASVDTL